MTICWILLGGGDIPNFRGEGESSAEMVTSCRNFLKQKHFPSEYLLHAKT